MELHQLRYFVAVAETGGFVKAAQRCGVAQPSLSQQIRKLEDELGVTLFDRSSRGAVPTEAGRALLPRAQRILAEVRDTMAGVKTFILQSDAPLTPAVAQPGAATALDHLVINTPNPERAVANYGARLGLRFALDRTAEQWKTRFLFFRLGGLTLEIIHRLGETQDPAADDSIWGLTWETDNLTAAHDRLSAAGVEVSELRTGRKPGTEVFTVRTHAQGIPTLFIAHSPR